MAKTVFDLKNSVSSFLALQKNKEQILFQVKPLKMSNKIFILLILDLFGDIRGFLRPCFAMRRVKKQQIKVKFWIWGPRTVYYIMTCAQNFCLKNHSTLLYNNY